MPEPTSHRNRYVALTGEDIRRFSELLTAAFPEARYYMQPTNKQINYLYKYTGGLLRTRPPRMLIHKSLFRVWRPARRWGADVWMVLDPSWRPVWYRTTHHPGNEYRAFWKPRNPEVYFQDIRGLVEKPRHTVRMGFLSVYCNPAFKEHFQFAAKFYRLLAKVASNRGFASVTIKTGEIKDVFVDKGAWAWVGHDARRWALEDPSRYATINWGETGLRPIPPRGRRGSAR